MMHESNVCDLFTTVNHSRKRLRMQVEIFHHFDKNDDGSLDLQEFLAMLKHTPLKIRQVRLSDHEESHLLKSWC